MPRFVGGEENASLRIGFSGDRDCGGHFRFGGIAIASAGIAKILFYLFLIAFVISLIMPPVDVCK
jgi:uncharacterized membrane protein YtjA (UPF0391 family)